MYMRRRYSTVQVAEKLGLDQGNLQKLIRQKRIPFPPLAKIGRMSVRLWSDKEVAAARKALKASRKKGKE
jgi:predicted DNA-binding transcriptional regulator AlpA